VPEKKALLTAPINGVQCFIKIYWRSGWIKKLKDLLRANRLACWMVRGSPEACRESKNIMRLKQLGFNTPSVIDFGRVRQSFLSSHSYLVLEVIADSETVWSFFRREFDQDLMEQVAHTLWEIHRHGFVHGDSHSKNILVAHEQEKKKIYLIDLLMLRRSRKQSHRLADITRFLSKNKRVWLDERAVQVFLDAYYRCANQEESLYLDAEDFKADVKKGLERFAPYDPGQVVETLPN
jgi:tRNA A-37 threonylcarbamoyl transferase component Bud32